MNIPFGRPHIGWDEIGAVVDVLQGHRYVHGPKIQAFEEAFAEFTGAKHAIAVSNATAAMHLVWFALGLKPGDEVLCSAQTHVATAHAISLTGATPVFVDARLDDGNMDPDLVEEKITPRTKGIAVVDFLGVPAPVGTLSRIAKKHDLFLLEDCALALGGGASGIMLEPTVMLVRSRSTRPSILPRAKAG